VQDTLTAIEDFQRNFKVFRNGPHGKNIEDGLINKWETIYKQKDHLNKVKDYLQTCQHREEALSGPRPEDLGEPDARQKSENSVVSLVNNVVRESGDLNATCDKAQRAIGDASTPGVADDLQQLSTMLERARGKINDMVVGDTAMMEAPPLLLALGLCSAVSKSRRIPSPHSATAPRYCRTWSLQRNDILNFL